MKPTDESEVRTMYEAVKSVLPQDADFLCIYIVRGEDMACTVSNAEPALARYFAHAINMALDQEEMSGQSSGVVDLRKQGNC